jgi:RNA polymerase sigma factor (sigma-70 family)
MTGGGEDLLEHWPAMVGACLRLLGSVEDAEDCASAALLSVVQRGGVGDVDSPRAWLVAVARRRAADVLRARARDDRRAQRLAAHHDMVEADVAEAVADRAEARWLTRTAEAAVPAPTRNVVRALASGMTVTEAADELGMTKRAAESHLHRARTTWRAVRAGALGVAVWTAACLRKALPAAPQAALAAAAVVTAVAVASPPAAPTPPAPPVAQTIADTAPAAKPSTRDTHARC